MSDKIIIGIFIFVYSSNTQENFGKYGIEFVRVGNVRYDLKGDPIRTRRVHNCYFDKRICYDDTFGNTERNTRNRHRNISA